jgi:tetratricopeptide (TPR) repeat protein
MVAENDRETDERDEDESDEGEGTAAPAQAGEATAPDPNLPRNRAERRMAAKAARRGREVKLADDAALAAAGANETPGDEGLLAPTTSIGGGMRPLAEGEKRPRVPPRTMSKGTGNTEGVPEWALRAGDWLAQNRSQVAMAFLAAVAIVGGAFGWQAYVTRREARATQAYYDGLTAMFAAITPDELPADDPRRNLPHYRSFEARAQATLEKLRRAIRAHPNARANPLMRLSEASTLYQLGRYTEAKSAYQGVLGADLAGLEGRAIEGLAFTLESLGDLDGALARYRELQSVQGGIYRDLAQFYQARVHLRRNDEARAREMLRTVIERVGRPAASDPTAAVQTALRDQCLALLRDIDPNDPVVVQADRQREAGGDAHGDAHGNDPMRGLPPELREQIQKMLRERGTGGGAPRPGGH